MKTFDIDLSRQTSLCISHNITIRGIPGMDAADAIAKAIEFASERAWNWQGATVLDTDARVIRIDHLRAL